MSQRTITLTGRPPVTIDEDKWPVIASARDSDHDGQHECQANRTWTWGLRVRQHEDGRAIVYAVYDATSQFRGEQVESAKHGVLLLADCAMADICQSIEDVASRMPGERWDELAAECIADLPAEILD